MYDFLLKSVCTNTSMSEHCTIEELNLEPVSSKHMYAEWSFTISLYE